MFAPFWDPLGLPLGTKLAKNEATLKGGRGSWRKLLAHGAQGRHQTPKILRKGTHVDPKHLQNAAKRVPLRRPSLLKKTKKQYPTYHFHTSFWKKKTGLSSHEFGSQFGSRSHPNKQNNAIQSRQTPPNKTKRSRRPRHPKGPQWTQGP